MSKIDDVIGRLLDLNEAGMSDYFVQNQKGWKKATDAWADGDMFNYMNMVIKEGSKKGGLKSGKFRGSEEIMMGTWAWSAGGERVVYITPFFESAKGVDVQSIWYKEDGEDIEEPTVIPFKPTGDPNKDFKSYMNIVNRVLRGYR